MGECFLPHCKRWGACVIICGEIRDRLPPKGVAMNRKSKRGISYLEYALLAALVGIVGAVGVMKYGKAIYNFFDTMAEKTTEVTPK